MTEQERDEYFDFYCKNREKPEMLIKFNGDRSRSKKICNPDASQLKRIWSK